MAATAQMPRAVATIATHPRRGRPVEVACRCLKKTKKKQKKKKNKNICRSWREAGEKKCTKVPAGGCGGSCSVGGGTSIPMPESEEKRRNMNGFDGLGSDGSQRKKETRMQTQQPFTCAHTHMHARTCQPFLKQYLALKVAMSGRWSEGSWLLGRLSGTTE